MTEETKAKIKLAKSYFHLHQTDEEREELRQKRIARSKKWRDENREKYLLGKKVNRLKSKYSLSIEEFNSMVLSQNGVCAICFSTTSSGLLCVDHNHTTGKVRGLLCHVCNRSLGMMKEDVNILQSAINYIQKYGN